MGKGAKTRDTILDQALDLSSEVGLEGLSFGVLAKLAGMSKSGLYAHFASKESLQCDVLDTAAARFVDVVLSPALKQPRGLPRIQKLFHLWLKWENEQLSGGCIFVAAATEFDDRPGAVRDSLTGHLRDMLGGVARAARIAVEEGHFHADLDAEQFSYEFWAVILAHQHYRRLLDYPDARERANRAFDSLIEKSIATG
ncbi:MAG: TetR/AcrR family transcriptional regulator [Proteobacteria bacterium]|jgi:AcrR family transcriptional regulator|nr:TetR/AcrR family transcriptional regulator [Pseudomonadota bacterium]